MFIKADGESSGALGREEPDGRGPVNCGDPVNGGGLVNGSGPASFSCSSERQRRKAEVQAAVDYMAAGNGEQRSTGRELWIVTAMLNDVPYLLSNFNALPDNYADRRSSLIDVFVSSTCSILLICSISQALAPFIYLICSIFSSL